MAGKLYRVKLVTEVELFIAAESEADAASWALDADITGGNPDAFDELEWTAEIIEEVTDPDDVADARDLYYIVNESALDEEE